MRNKKVEMKRLCEKCGKEQPKNESQSNENWNVYDCNAKCECGGEYRLHLNGICLEVQNESE